MHYNLACSYSLTQQCELAAEALNTAINLGYNDFGWMARDPDLKFSANTPGIRKSRPKSAAFRKPEGAWRAPVRFQAGRLVSSGRRGVIH